MSRDRAPVTDDYRQRVAAMSATDKLSNVHGEFLWVLSGHGGQVLEAGAQMDAMLQELIEAATWLVDAGFLAALPVAPAGSSSGGTR